jgi:hypothetical protein
MTASRQVQSRNTPDARLGLKFADLGDFGKPGRRVGREFAALQAAAPRV